MSKRQYKNYTHLLDYTKKGPDIASILIKISIIVSAIFVAIFLANYWPFAK